MLLYHNHISEKKKYFLNPASLLRGIACCVRLRRIIFLFFIQQLRRSLPRAMRWVTHLYFLFSWHPSSAQPASATYDFSNLQSKIQSWMDSGYYNGASIILVKDNKVIYKNYFGNYKPETVAYIASAGKWLAAATIAAVVDEGKLNWNDKIKKWLPEFTDIKGEASLAQLLSHIAGYPDYQPKGNPTDIYQTLKESVAHIVNLPADTLPGTKFKYGGLAMQVAGRMAELATGKDWETIFQQKIAGPLGMLSTHFTPVDSSGGHAPMLGGGARTTLQDYANFLSMIINNGMFNGKRILSAGSIQTMQADQVLQAKVVPGEFVEKARASLRKDIYGLGEWREEVNEKNAATLISSPSWAGAYPWIDKKNNLYGFFMTHISNFKKGFNSFYASPVLSMLARDAVNKSVAASASAHPRLYASDEQKPAILQKIKNVSWAADAWHNLLNSIDPYVNRHQTDPKWIISRLAMYWKDGEHYTQCYVKKEHWDHGEGNAPVPTVRLPGMRTWNEYSNVPLEQRIPYNESGDMKATSKAHPEKGVVTVPYKESGHLIRGNNVEILTLAENASFAYWISGEEKYAGFAADIFNTWLQGTYYMNPPLDPGRDSRGPGGYEPGGIMGYYDYEVIHDDLSLHAAAVYDFLYNYLQQHPDVHLASINKNINEVAATVFKRFIDISMVRGSKKGNWNVNGWNMILRNILVLDEDNQYADGKGREYYLKFFTTASTKYHDALPDILEDYDPVTGLWSEAPGYALSTINMLVDLAIPVYHSGIDLIGSNPVMQKAAMAVFPWLDARGNLVVFGDMRGGPADYTTFERLLYYYTKVNDSNKANIVAAALQKGLQAQQYNRGKTGWPGICTNVDQLPVTAVSSSYARAAYSPVHRHLILKNGNDVDNGLMFTLYGGYPKQKHLSPNGLAIQLYGKGWALAPDASGYESYWTDDYNYHQSVTGSNTIVPGYSSGPITINAMEPAINSNAFTNTGQVSPYCSFADVSADEKRRMVAIIRTSATTGYYVDVFHSALNDNDYLWHNLGNSFSLTDVNGKPLPVKEAGRLDTAYHIGYKYFRQAKNINYSKDIQARWTITTTSPSITMNMWMKGAANRSICQVYSPYTNLIDAVTPNKVNIAPDSTAALIISQRNKDGWKTPFIAVFEPYDGNNRSIKDITALPTTEEMTALLIESNPLNKELDGRKEYVLYSVSDKIQQPGKDIQFNGVFGVVSENRNGFQWLYLGKGKLLSKGKYKIAADTAVAAGLINKNGFITYSAADRITITLPYQSTAANYKDLRIFYKADGKYVEAKGNADAGAKTITGMVPAGYDVEIKVMAIETK